MIHHSNAPFSHPHPHSRTHTLSKRQPLHVCILIVSTHRSIRLTVLFFWRKMIINRLSSHLITLCVSSFMNYCFLHAILRFAITPRINISNSSNHTYNIILWKTTKKNETKSILYIHKNKQKTSKQTNNK